MTHAKRGSRASRPSNATAQRPPFTRTRKTASSSASAEAPRIGKITSRHVTSRNAPNDICTRPWTSSLASADTKMLVRAPWSSISSPARSRPSLAVLTALPHLPIVPFLIVSFHLVPCFHIAAPDNDRIFMPTSLPLSSNVLTKDSRAARFYLYIEFLLGICIPLFLGTSISSTRQMCNDFGWETAGVVRLSEYYQSIQFLMICAEMARKL